MNQSLKSIYPHVYLNTNDIIRERTSVFFKEIYLLIFQQVQLYKY